MVDAAQAGPAIRLLRQYRRLKQNEMARRAGITRAMAFVYERGERVAFPAYPRCHPQRPGCNFGTLSQALSDVEQRTGKP